MCDKLIHNKAVQESNALHFLKVHGSPIQGQGLFTEVNLEADSVLFKLNGEKMYHAYNPVLAAENPNWIGVGYGEWIKLAPGELCIYINHSCRPNVIIDQYLNIVTLSPVEAFEELLLDYSTTELDPYWEMHCCCGEHNCRKILKAFPFLPYHVSAKYSKYIAPVFAAMAHDLVMVK